METPERYSQTERLSLIQDLYLGVFDAAESFEKDNIGSDLAYLMGEISKGDYCEWSEDRPFIQVLRKLYGPEHRVWKFINIVE